MAVQVVKLIDPINNVVITGGLVPKGEYDNATDYAVGDFVSYGGDSYIMYVNAGAGTLPTDDTKWMLVAEQGQDGEGVPTGGTEGQHLIKSSGTDFDTEWADDLSLAYAIAL